ncbi:MAG: hypothetical protein A2Y15_08695 [Clostridiales bacterium GWF2_36_10]|nr:MAG: hypothetical protein A2Y15_08695 [Clostridiales bacterium GWF2_36_10]HAN20421.1 Head fiber protein [Clostridiales bacterium]
MYTAKNHSEGPDKTVIGGELIIEAGGKVKFEDVEFAPAANQAASVEATTPTVAEFNALLVKLKAAGIMVADA